MRSISVVKCAAVVAALALLAGCGGSAGETPPGRDRPAAAARPTVVSLVPAVTEMLFAIGAGEQVIAVSSFDNWPPEVARLPRVGALLDPDVERILRLRPDVLVLHVSQDQLKAQAERAGIKTFTHATGGLSDVTKTMRELGAAVGRAEEAGAAAAGIESRLAGIGRRAKETGRPRTLVVFGREPGSLRAIDASGGVGFLHDLVELAGGRNVFASEPRESVRVSTEAILAAAPEVIVELRYGQEMSPAETEAERAAWNALPAVPAVRDGRVHVLAGDYLVIPGPRVVQAAEEIYRAVTSPAPPLPSTPRTTPAGWTPASPRSTPPGRRRSRAAPAPTAAGR